MPTRAVLLFAFLLPALSASSPPPEYIGRWKGNAQVGVNFIQTRQLRLDIVIHTDGKITGTVGDALIAGGAFGEHTWLEKLFGNKGYVLRVRLRGDLFRTEQIRRRGAFILLHGGSGGQLTGAVNSSGSEGVPGFGPYNRAHMIVACHHLRLVKQ